MSRPDVPFFSNPCCRDLPFPAAFMSGSPRRLLDPMALPVSHHIQPLPLLQPLDLDAHRLPHALGVTFGEPIGQSLDGLVLRQGGPPTRHAGTRPAKR